MIQTGTAEKNKIHDSISLCFSASCMIVETIKYCRVHKFLNLYFKPFKMVQNIRLLDPLRWQEKKLLIAFSLL